ncbi:MAG: hypothetical protein E7573_10305 [Ruminococcaceae bacterium]|nr:hypothetical protein [Oscillospiraceae bacterium]MBR3596169.1 hypothetical protein [Clostridia bacterium]
MRMSDDVELFIKGCYPKGVPLYRKAELRKELLSHIFDKADSLIKTGMSETESIAEAVKEMGDPSKIRQSFGKVYRFERLPGIIAFVVLTFVCVSAFFLGFLSFGAHSTGDFPTVYHYFVSASFIGSIIFIYIYSYRKKNVYLLLSVTVYLMLNIATFLLTSGIFQSALIGIGVIVCALFGVPEHTVSNGLIYVEAEPVALGFGFYGSMILMPLLLIIGIVLLMLILTASRRKRTKEKKKKPLLLYFSLICSIVILSSVLFSIAAKEYEFMDSNVMKSSFVGVNNPKKARKAYEELTKAQSVTDTEIILRSYGFYEINKEKDIMSSHNFEPGYSMPDSRVFCLENGAYSYDPLYNDCVIILNFSEGKLSYKQLYCYKESLAAFGFSKYEDTSEFYENYLSLSEGDIRSDVLKKFPRDVAFLEGASHDFETDTEKLNFGAFYSEKKDPRISTDMHAEIMIVGSILSDKKIRAYGKDEKYDYKEQGLSY